MNCPKCQTVNALGNAFCVTCGENFSASQNLPPTMVAGQNPANPPIPNQTGAPSKLPTQEFPSNAYQPGSSEQTVFGGGQNYQAGGQNYQQPQFGRQPPQFGQSSAGFNQFQPNFQASIPNMPVAAKKSRLGLWLGLGGFLLLLLGGVLVVGVWILTKNSPTNESFPTSLGLFFQNADKTQITEMKKQDFASAIAGKDTLLKDEALPVLEAKPNLILYSDGKDIPLNDLKLVQLDSMKDDGTMKQVEYKVTPVEGKTDMKRLWVPENLANGKYAFALFDGFLDDGKHKFWAFQVKNSDKTDNGELAKSVTGNVKSKSNSSNTNQKKDEKNANTATPTPAKVTAPVGSTTSFVQMNNVVLRSGPSQASGKIGALSSGQKVYVINYSDDYETFVTRDGRELYSNYAYIQTETGKRGWVYAAFLK